MCALTQERDPLGANGQVVGAVSRAQMSCPDTGARTLERSASAVRCATGVLCVATTWLSMSSATGAAGALPCGRHVWSPRVPPLVLGEWKPQTPSSYRRRGHDEAHACLVGPHNMPGLGRHAEKMRTSRQRAPGSAHVQDRWVRTNAWGSCTV